MMLLSPLFRFSQLTMRTGLPSIFTVKIVATQLGKWLNLPVNMTTFGYIEIATNLSNNLPCKGIKTCQSIVITFYLIIKQTIQTISSSVQYNWLL